MRPVLFRRRDWPVLKNSGWSLGLLVLGSVLWGVASDTTEVMRHRIGNQTHW